MKEKGITELSMSFSRRTAANGKIDFGILRTKKLTHFLHWVHDDACTFYTPSTTGYLQTSLLTALSDSGERADVQNQLRDKLDVRAKEVSPGPLVSENKWTDWKPMFANYLSTMLVMNSVPLSYIIRDNDAPDRTSTFPDLLGRRQGSESIDRGIHGRPSVRRLDQPSALSKEQTCQHVSVTQLFLWRK